MSTMQRVTNQGWRDWLSVEAFFRWYDLWIGAYWDRSGKALYVCPVPMFGIKVTLHMLRRAPTPKRSVGEPR